MKPEKQEAVRQEIRTFFRQLNNMFFMFLAGIFLFLITALVVVYFQKALSPDYTTYLYFGAPISSVALIIMARKLASDRFKAAVGMQKLYEKMDAYRSGAILQMILLDGSAFIFLLAYIFSGQKLFIFLSLVVVMLFFLYKPGMEKFMRELQLSELEKQVIRDHSY